MFKWVTTVAYFILAISFSGSCHAYIQCNSKYECVGEAINHFRPVTSNGFKANFGSTSSIASGFYGSINVRGEFGSADSSLSTINGRSISISGANGAINSNIDTGTTYNSNSGVRINAANGASNSVITSRNIQINADMGGYGSHFIVDGTYAKIEVYGSYGAAYSVIDTFRTGSSSWTVYKDIILDGYYAGYGAILTCESGDTCRIDCRWGNGCYGFQLNCMSGSNCVVSNCDELQGSHCPITYGFDTLPPLKTHELSYQFDIVSQATLNDNKCSDRYQTALTYDDYVSSSNLAGVSVTTSTGNVCCRSSYACRAAAISITGTGDHDIVCGGASACGGSAFSTITSLAVEPSGNRNIYCSGSGACVEGIITGAVNGMIYCGGSGACDATQISSTDRVYCSGNEACAESTISSVGNVYVSGSEGIDGAVLNSDGVGVMNVYLFIPNPTAWWRDATINCNDANDICNIYCKTHGSCDGIVINSICNNANVECDPANGIDCPTIINTNTGYICPSTPS